MSQTPHSGFSGGCSCGAVRYHLCCAPLFTHCCHCSWCQRESGAAFALNALIETGNLHLDQGEVLFADTPSASGKGQKIARCPACHVALWSHYAGAGPKLAFVRVGTLDAGHGIAPDVHIYTSTKQPWVRLGDASVPVKAGYYDRQKLWPAPSLARRAALFL